MARTPAGVALSSAHRQQQITVRASLLRELLALWEALVDPADFGTFERFAELAARLIGLRREESTGLAAAYFAAFRRVEGAAGIAAAVPAAAVPAEQVAAVVRGAALVGATDARRAGRSHPVAARQAFVRASGSATRVVVDGARDTVVESVRADPDALGWQRITDPDPCPFCRMVASRGPAFKSRRSAAFEAHDGCACVAEPFYRGSDPPPANERFEQQWRQAQEWARQPGNASRGTANNALNNFRRFLATRQQ